jgi:hypothetical protein
MQAAASVVGREDMIIDVHQGIGRYQIRRADCSKLTGGRECEAMQFHLNGFRPGDQQISEAAEPADASPHSDPLPEEIDVLIVGCGPAGLTLAAQLAAFPDIKTRIVDQKSGPVRLTASRAAQWRCSRRSVSASGC